MDDPRFDWPPDVFRDYSRYLLAFCLIRESAFETGE